MHGPGALPPFPSQERFEPFATASRSLPGQDSNLRPVPRLGPPWGPVKHVCSTSLNGGKSATCLRLRLAQTHPVKTHFPPPVPPHPPKRSQGIPTELTR